MQAIQALEPRSHTIIEAHPDVYSKVRDLDRCWIELCLLFWSNGAGIIMMLGWNSGQDTRDADQAVFAMYGAVYVGIPYGVVDILCRCFRQQPGAPAWTGVWMAFNASRWRSLAGTERRVWKLFLVGGKTLLTSWSSMMAFSSTPIQSTMMISGINWPPFCKSQPFHVSREFKVRREWIRSSKRAPILQAKDFALQQSRGWCSTMSSIRSDLPFLDKRSSIILVIGVRHARVVCNILCRHTAREPVRKVSWDWCPKP